MSQAQQKTPLPMNQSQQVPQGILCERPQNLCEDLTSVKKLSSGDSTYGGYAEMDTLPFSTITSECKQRKGTSSEQFYVSHSSMNSQAVTALESDDHSCSNSNQCRKQLQQYQRDYEALRKQYNILSHNYNKVQEQLEELHQQKDQQNQEQYQLLNPARNNAMRQEEYTNQQNQQEDLPRSRNLSSECGRLEDKFTGQINKAFRLMYENLKEESDQIITQKDQEIFKLRGALDEALIANEQKQAALIELADCYYNLRCEVAELANQQQAPPAQREEEREEGGQNSGQQQKQLLLEKSDPTAIVNQSSQDEHSTVEKQQDLQEVCQQRYETFSTRPQVSSSQMQGEENYISTDGVLSRNNNHLTQDMNGNQGNSQAYNNSSNCKNSIANSKPNKECNQLGQFLQFHQKTFQKDREEIDVNMQNMQKEARLKILAKLKQEVFSEGLKQALLPAQMNMTFRKATGKGRTSTKINNKMRNLDDSKQLNEEKEDRGEDCSQKIQTKIIDQRNNQRQEEQQGENEEDPLKRGYQIIQQLYTSIDKKLQI